ncbi:MAG: rhomboid family intramembrane serine protease [Pseudoxanthomonas sp.]
MITLLIIAATVAVSLLALNNPKLMERLILWPPAIDRQRQYDRLIGYGLVHADFMHLFFNMFTLYFFGRAIEAWMAYLGKAWAYPLFYVSALVVSILPSYLRNQHNPNYHSLGASGAVSAVLFAFILLQPWSMIGVFFIPMPAIVFAVLYVAYSIWMDKHGHDNVNHGAHLAGAAYGVLFLLCMRPQVLAGFLERLAHPHF